ncbi:MAG: hypothetical protein JWP63_1560 [Candidatus Solibacter sp.]|nr:hypothetical protein [Candidatus Solibacter sp.]
MLSPKDSPLGKQLGRYVCVRITRMDDVDVGLFDRDWNNTIYFFAMNADEQIYFRYGGRDSASPDTYLNVDSLELALRQGAEMHERGVKLPPRPKALYPREIPLLVQRTFAQRQCVECHLIGDFQNLQREQDGVLDKLTHLYRSPDIKTLGIELDVPKGLVVKQASGAAAAAGMQAGDKIVAWNGAPVLTFGDLQYQYDKVDRKSTKVTAQVERGASLEIALPERWWWTDLRLRQSSVDPRLDFEDRPLSADEKKKFGLPADGFASMVKYVSDFAKIRKTHELRTGDIIYAVDKVERDDLANTAELFLKLRKKAGQAAALSVIRDGKRIEMPLQSYQLSFRK